MNGVAFDYRFVAALRAASVRMPVTLAGAGLGHSGRVRKVRTRLWLTCLFIGLSHPLLCTCSGEVAGASTLTVDEIREKLLQRQDHFESLEITWSATHTTRKGAMGQTVEGTPLPDRDTSHKVHYRVVLQNDKIRHTRTGPFWSYGDKSFVDAEQTITYDGRTSQSYDAQPKGEITGTGVVHQRRPDRVHLLLRGDWQYSAVVFAFRPLSEAFDTLHVALAGSTSIAEYNGKSCLIVSESLGGVSNREFWIDAQRGLVVRQRILRGRTVRSDLTIKYGNKSNIGLVPVAWEYREFQPRSGEVLESSVVEDVLYKRLSEVPDSEFSIVWKPGNLVHDDNSPGKWSVADGRGELHLQQRRIFGSRSTDAAGRSAFWLGLGTMGIVIVLAAIVLRRRLRAS